MESGGRIHPSRRRANTDTNPYSFLDVYTLADNDSHQDSYTFANFHSHSLSYHYRYPVMSLRGALRATKQSPTL